MGLVFEHGSYTPGTYMASVDRKQTKEYRLWTGMLRRCYSKDVHKVRPRYQPCKVSDEFLDFQYFAAWCNRQIGFNEKDYQLDKDLLLKGNTTYSEEFCVFLPREINQLLVSCNSARGDLPVGVCWHKRDNVYTAQISVGGDRVHIGNYTSEADAFYAYKIAKERYARGLADKYRKSIDIRAFQALLNFSVDLND